MSLAMVETAVHSARVGRGVSVDETPRAAATDAADGPVLDVLRSWPPPGGARRGPPGEPFTTAPP